MSTPSPVLIAVSEHGRRLAAQVAGQLVGGSPREALQQAWRSGESIVFFGAAGIAVRLIAPLLGSKTTDPAVVVVDDAGRHAISLVAGHEGGANALARSVARQIGAEVVITTASELLTDRGLVLGIGCSRGASAADIEALSRTALQDAGASIESVACVATIDLKQDEAGLIEFAARWHVPLRFFTAAELNAVPVESPSAAVASAVGTPSVAEAAALLASDGGSLLAAKRKSANVTAAVGRLQVPGWLSIVGLGPGGRDQLTFEALEALRTADEVVGYSYYTEMVRDWLPLAHCTALPLGQEGERAQLAIDAALAGRRVALVCSGDAGIYALAGLVYEHLGATRLKVQVVPGITAAVSAAALLGAPLMADFATMSLSDLHVPAEVILGRLEAAAQADMVAVLYNPASHRRRQMLADAVRVFLTHRQPETPVGLVRNAYRPDQAVRIFALANVPLDEVDMFTVIVIGNSHTELIGGRMVTRRHHRLSS